MSASENQTAAPRSEIGVSLITAAAAFATYFCMYAFRKPFTAGTYEDQLLWGWGLKTVLVTSQLLGYALSKLIGIKIVSEMSRRWRTLYILGFIAFAELSLVGFAVLPAGAKPVMLFLNGLPLGMVFGLVLAFLEGRKQTEALTAGLCASFVISSGVVKSVGRSLVHDYGVSEFWMPAVTGLIFLVPLLVAVWFLQQTPEPSLEDQQLRMKRTPMSRQERWSFFRTFAPGLTLLLLIYIALTVMRSLRDDFGVEIWRSLGYGDKPQVFAQTELIVAFVVTALNAVAIVIRRNRLAFQAVLGLVAVGFGLVFTSLALLKNSSIGGYSFMILCGIGLYLPYIAFHTTIFERLIAASRRPGNMGFLMYLADTVGYFGYVGLLLLKKQIDASADFLGLFQNVTLVLSTVCIIFLVIVAVYFHRAFPREPTDATVANNA